MEGQWYRVETTCPETLVDELCALGLQLAEVSVAAGDAYGGYVVECCLAGDAALLDAAERTWQLHPCRVA